MQPTSTLVPPLSPVVSLIKSNSLLAKRHRIRTPGPADGTRPDPQADPQSIHRRRCGLPLIVFGPVFLLHFAEYSPSEALFNLRRAGIWVVPQPEGEPRPPFRSALRRHAYMRPRGQNVLVGIQHHRQGDWRLHNYLAFSIEPFETRAESHSNRALPKESY